MNSQKKNDYLRDELNHIHFFYVKSPTGDTQIGCVIDGRKYSKPEDVRHDFLEAGRHLDARLMLMEVETLPIEPRTPTYPHSPSWKEYKRRLPRLEPKIFNK
ncbi:MAG: hypothetical protein WAM60_06685 [Candidatus Promineifilaceae bacterium]